MLPAFALALSGIGQAARLTRSNMVETYDKPYIEMAQSYGFPEKRIANRYAFRPSLIPSLTIIGLDFAAMLGNAFLVEAVFAWPGLSRYGVAVILRKDLNAIIGTVLIISAMFLIVNVIVDLLIAFINPRIRYSQRARDEAAPLAHPRCATRCRCSGWSLIALVVLSAIFADFITPFPAHVGAVVDFANFNKAPEWPYIFGTDLVGRDLFTRIVYAYRISLILGVVVLAIAVPIGVTIGLVAGYLGGWIEYVLMRITDVFLSIPPLVLAMSMMGVLEPTLTNGMIAVTAMWWPWYTRLVYNLTRSEKEEGYVLAAEVIGASTAHVMFREILPNCVPSILTKMTLDLGFVILIASSLSFLGLGVQPPTPDLGSMVADGAKYLPDSLVADGVSRPGDPGRGVRLQPGRRRACARFWGPSNERADAAHPRPQARLPHLCRHGRGAARHLAAHRQGRARRAGRRIRLGQVGDGAHHPRPAAAAAERAHLRAGRVRRPRPGDAVGTRASRRCAAPGCR